MTHIIDGVKLNFSDVLLVPKRSTLGSRKDVVLHRHFKFGITAIPVIAANMDTVGTMEMAVTLAEEDMMTVLHKFYTVKELLAFGKKLEHTGKMNNNIFLSFGITQPDLDKLDYLRFHGFFPNICLDVANGYSERFIKVVKDVREKYPSIRLMAGNVCTSDVTAQLILAGADIVKIGIGPGSVCETRLKTGVGYPQLSAIMECAEAAHGLRGYVCADGGCSTPGDVAKAFGAGADFVMLGGMFAGHYEAVEDKSKLKYGSYHVRGDDRHIETIFHKEPEPDQEIEYYGMSSKAAMDKHYGGVAEHRTTEGKTSKIKYRGPVKATVTDILGGLRSACTYIGAETIKDFPKCATFARIA